MFLAVHPDGLIIIKHTHFKILNHWENVDCKRNPAQSTYTTIASTRSSGHDGACAWEAAAKPPRDPTASFLHTTEWETLLAEGQMHPSRQIWQTACAQAFFWGATLASDPASSMARGQGNFDLSAHGGSEGFLLLTQEQRCAFSASLKAPRALHGSYGVQSRYQVKDATSNPRETQRWLQA